MDDVENHILMGGVYKGELKYTLSSFQKYKSMVLDGFDVELFFVSFDPIGNFFLWVVN